MAKIVSRRAMVRCLAVAPFTTQFLVFGCGGGGAQAGGDVGGDLPRDMVADGGSDVADTGVGDADAVDAAEQQDLSSDTDSGADASSLEWAAGTTALISVDFPSDDLFEDAAPCAVSLIGATTLGPCYFADDTGEDISSGLEGLPMQLCLRLIDEACNPLAGHVVEIWHCDADGVYSGDFSQSRDTTGFNQRFCTGGDADAIASTWYRGQLTTDASGRVNFKTHFPGWYPGRTVHIHFAISEEGERKIISQLCFSDPLAAEIYTAHTNYVERGDQDTPLSRDGIFPTADLERFQLRTERNSDGTMLAYQTIQVAS